MTVFQVEFDAGAYDGFVSLHGLFEAQADAIVARDALANTWVEDGAYTYDDLANRLTVVARDVMAASDPGVGT